MPCSLLASRNCNTSTRFGMLILCYQFWPLRSMGSFAHTLKQRTARIIIFSVNGELFPFNTTAWIFAAFVSFHFFRKMSISHCHKVKPFVYISFLVFFALSRYIGLFPFCVSKHCNTIRFGWAKNTSNELCRYQNMCIYLDRLCFFIKSISGIQRDDLFFAVEHSIIINRVIFAHRVINEQPLHVALTRRSFNARCMCKHMFISVFSYNVIVIRCFVVYWIFTRMPSHCFASAICWHTETIAACDMCKFTEINSNESWQCCMDLESSVAFKCVQILSDGIFFAFLYVCLSLCMSSIHLNEKKTRTYLKITLCFFLLLIDF